MMYFICINDHKIPLFMWLEPNGNYHPVKYAEHIDAAFHIVYDLIDQGLAKVNAINNPEEYLENQGWVKVSCFGYLMQPGRKATQEQLYVINEHYDLYKNTTYKTPGGGVGVLDSSTLNSTLQDIL